MTLTATSRPDRVVVLTTDFRPMIGGVADHLHRLAHDLAPTMPVTVMTTVPPDGVEWEREYRLELVSALPERRLGRRIGDAFAPIRKLHTGLYFLALRRHADRTLARVQADGRGDAAIIVGIWDTASHFWCEASIRAGLPYYLVSYGLDVIAPLYGHLPAWRAADFAGAVRVIACSRATADLASQRFALATPPAVVNPSAGPRPPVRDVESRATVLRRQVDLGDLNAGPVLLTVGRLVARKGFDLVLKSVAELRGDYPDLHYVIVGDGPQRAHLETLARDLGIAACVRMLGQVDELTKWAAYELCDVFVMPNRVLGGADWEGFGIVFVEAALAGRPSIGGRTGGAADAVIDQVTGLLVDPECPDELTQTLRRLLNDRPLRCRLGEAGREMAATRFSQQASAQSLRMQLGWN